MVAEGLELGDGSLAGPVGVAPLAALHGGVQLAFTVASGFALASAAVAALVIPGRADAQPAAPPPRIPPADGTCG